MNETPSLLGGEGRGEGAAEEGRGQKDSPNQEPNPAQHLLTHNNKIPRIPLQSQESQFRKQLDNHPNTCFNKQQAFKPTAIGPNAQRIAAARGRTLSRSYRRLK